MNHRKGYSYEDQIIIIDTYDEAVKLGWTKLGQIEQRGCWQDTVEVWCKAGDFVLIADCGNGYCCFVKYISREEAMKRLIDEENKYPRFDKIEYSIAPESLRECSLCPILKGSKSKAKS